MPAPPNNLVRHFCERCGMYRDGLGVRWVQSGRSQLASCSVCGDALRSEQQRIAEPYLVVLARAFLFPFKPWMLATIFAAGIGVGVIRFLPFLGVPLSGTIMLSLLFAIIRATAEGMDDLGMETGSTSFSEWLYPLLRYVLTLFVAFGPAGVLALKLGYPEGAHLVLPAIALGVIYFPAGIIVAAHNEGCIAPLNPLIGLRLIARIPGPYFVTLGFLAVTLVATWLLQLAIGVAYRALSPIPILPAILAVSASLLGPVVMARMLGLLLREHGEEL